MVWGDDNRKTQRKIRQINRVLRNSNIRQGTTVVAHPPACTLDIQYRNHRLQVRPTQRPLFLCVDQVLQFHQ
jgi:hypothetical protein